MPAFLAVQRTWRRPVSLCLLLGCCLFCFGCGSPTVSPENAKKVVKGLTLQQVERILGTGKDGRYPDVDQQWDKTWLEKQGIPENATWKHWRYGGETESQKNIVYNVAFVDGKVVNTIVHSENK